MELATETRREIMEVSILLPCLNEAETLSICINKAIQFLIQNDISGEIVVADNGSTDGSQAIANESGAVVVNVVEKGYGSALIGGITNAKGKYIIMGDADDSYDFSSLQQYVEKLREGYDLVMGNRFKGGIKPGAMPFLHRYLGNPVLSFIGRLFFGSGINDFHCGLRGFSKEAALNMDLKCKGMEFASEMVVKATLLNMKVTEVPTVLYPDGRSRPPHLKTWRDGWRHLRFLLMFSPTWLFLYPGLFAMLLGSIVSAFLIVEPIQVFNIVLDVHTLLYTSSFVLLGFQSVAFYVFTKIYAINTGLLPPTKQIKDALRYFNLEKGIVMGIFFILLGITLSLKSLIIWQNYNFGILNTSMVLRWVIPACTTLLLGFQVFLYSFFFSILSMKN